MSVEPGPITRSPDNAAHDAILIDPFEPAISTVGAWTYVQSVSFFNAKYSQSSGAQNDEMVFAPRFFRGGTWALTLLHQAGNNRGIFSIAISTDNANWTTLGTIDSYNAASTNTRSVLTGLTIGRGRYYVRVKMATKNASSASYFAQIQALMFVRTGA